MNQLARKLARLLAQNSHNSVYEDEVRYGIEVILGSIFQVVLLLAIASLLGLVYQTLGILLASALFRRYSGGAHCTAYYRCTLTSLITFLPLAYLTGFLLTYNNLVITCCAAIVVLTIAWIQAPVDNPTKPITDPVQRQALRKKSLIAAVILCLAAAGLLFIFPLGSTAIMVGLLWQSITLTAPGHIYMSLWDNTFLYIEKLIRRGDYYVKQS